MVKTAQLIGPILGALVLASPAAAVPPTLLSVGQSNRHPFASFSTPRAFIAATYLSTKPDRGSDGGFLEENIKAVDILTDSEIQSGQWSYESPIDPGTYWVMVGAFPDFPACEVPGTGTLDQACSNGFSNALKLVVPEPRARYTARVNVDRYLGQVSLGLVASPLGERRGYRVCYRLTNGRARCVNGTLYGYDWNSSAQGALTISTSNLARVAIFSWYVDGARVATRRVRVR